MIYEVFHADEPKFSDELPENFPAGFTKVADVVIDGLNVDPALDYVYQMTNHIDSDWTQSDKVTPTSWARRSGARSTSVGDVVVDPNGERHLVAGLGWRKF